MTTKSNTYIMMYCTAHPQKELYHFVHSLPNDGGSFWETTARMKKLIRVILVTVLLISIFLYCSFACDDNYDVNELNMPQLYKDFLQGRIAWSVRKP